MDYQVTVAGDIFASLFNLLAKGTRLFENCRLNCEPEVFGKGHAILILLIGLFISWGLYTGIKYLNRPKEIDNA